MKTSQIIDNISELAIINVSEKLTSGIIVNELLERNEPGEMWKLSFSNKRDMAMCPINGEFKSCDGCDYVEDSCCIKEYTYLDDDEAAVYVEAASRCELKIDVRDFEDKGRF